MLLPKKYWINPSKVNKQKQNNNEKQKNILKFLKFFNKYNIDKLKVPNLKKNKLLSSDKYGLSENKDLIIR